MRILDLYCGAGGAAVGYDRAGFEVVGVDYSDQPNYPFPFYKGSAVDIVEDGVTVAMGALNILLMGGKLIFGDRAYALGDFDAIHASPPCQSSSALTKGTNFGKFEYPDFIPATRSLLEATELPYVIENVAGADIRKDIKLCGEMFALAVIRHRYFEVNFPVEQPEHIKHRGRVAGMRHGEWFQGPYFAVYGEGGGKGTVKQWQDAMDISWTNVRKEIAEAIPPAYTEYLGYNLAEHLKNLDARG